MNKVFDTTRLEENYIDLNINRLLTGVGIDIKQKEKSLVFVEDYVIENENGKLYIKLLK